MSEVNWTEYFFRLAQTVSIKSKDPNTKIGAVIVGPQNEIVSTGYNSIVRGVNDASVRMERPEKYVWMEHAERNAIYNAARVGVSTVGCRMYCFCDIACLDCTRAIIQAGISEVNFIAGEGAKGTKYTDPDDMERNLLMLKEAGVKVKVYTPEYECAHRRYYRYWPIGGKSYDAESYKCEQCHKMGVRNDHSEEIKWRS